MWPMKTSAGFATSAATLASLAISLVVAAVVASAISQLRLAQAQMTEAKVQAALDGAHRRAAMALMEPGRTIQVHWAIATSSGDAEAVAESEGAKLSLAAASKLEPDQLQRLGVSDPSELRSRLVALAAAPSAQGLDLYSADDAAIWRACARSIVSPYGGDRLPTAAQKSSGGPDPNGRRAGEVWRIRLTLTGWTDDRVVRFTGDTHSPVGVIARRFYRWSPAAEHCPQILN